MALLLSKDAFVHRHGVSAPQSSSIEAITPIKKVQFIQERKQFPTPLFFFPGGGGAPTGFWRSRLLTATCLIFLFSLSKFDFFFFFLKEFSSIFTEGGVPPPVLGEVGGFLFFGLPAGDYPRSVLVEGGILFHV